MNIVSYAFFRPKPVFLLPPKSLALPLSLLVMIFTWFSVA